MSSSNPLPVITICFLMGLVVGYALTYWEVEDIVESKFHKISGFLYVLALLILGGVFFVMATIY